MSRIVPVPRSELSEFEEYFRRYEERMGYLPNSVLLMGRRPEILRSFIGLADVVLRSGRIAPTLKAMVAHIASRSAGCQYCQAHTAHNAHHLGVDEDKVRAVWDFEVDDRFSDAERAALRLARDGAQVPNAVTSDDFDRLAQHFDAEEVIELVAVIALFGWLNRWNDILATELEDRPRGFAERALGPDGWTVGKHAGTDRASG